jgi:hypothetical protein
LNLFPIPSLINGHSYEWADIQLSIAGAPPVNGITSIDYGFKREMKNVYGAGDQPVSRGYGSVVYDGSITIKMEELEPIIAVAPPAFPGGGPDITRIPEFTIVVAFLDSQNTVVVNTLNNVKFMAHEFKTKQGDTSIDFVIPILIGSITYS